MARIAKYSFDSQVTADDFVIGSDSVNKRTRNYKVGDLAAFFAANQPGRITYKYNQTADFENISYGELSFGNYFQTNTNLRDVTAIYISPITLGNKNIYEYLNAAMENGSIKIHKGVEFGVYRIHKIDTIQNGVLELVVDLHLGNGTLTDQDTVYISANVKADSYKATPELSGNIWEIEHNLGKYPSVTVVDTANNVIYGEILYIDTNNVKVTFSANVTGRAYLN